MHYIPESFRFFALLSVRVLCASVATTLKRARVYVSVTRN